MELELDDVRRVRDRARARRRRWCASGPAAHGIDARPRRRRRTSGSVRRRRAAAQAGAAQPAHQRGEVHPGRRARSTSRAPRARPTSSCVTVTDTGIGIAPEDRERIFESFQQGGRGAAQEEGTGLGLTLSPADRRAARRPDVARERGRARAARSGSRCPVARGPAVDERRAEPGGGRRSLRGRGRPGLAGPDDRLPRRAPASHVVARPRRPRRPRRGPPRTARPRWCSTSGCPAWTAGRCSGR